MVFLLWRGKFAVQVEGACRAHGLPERSIDALLGFDSIGPVI
jgi:hypothetical protein